MRNDKKMKQTDMLRVYIALTKGVFLARIVTEYFSVHRIPERLVHVDRQSVGHTNEEVHEEGVVNAFRHLHRRHTRTQAPDQQNDADKKDNGLRKLLPIRVRGPL